MHHPQQSGQPQGTGPGQQSTDRGQTQLFPTQNYLSEDVRAAVIGRLNRRLADTTILMTHAKFAHWNVKGMEFYGLHQLFDEIAEVFESHVDEIAERITALGGQAKGTAEMAVANCNLPQMPAGAVTGGQYVELLADRLAIHDANLYDDVEATNACNDLDTADLLNELSREVSQYLWFLEAHLQTQPLQTAPAGTTQSQQGGSPAGQHPQSQDTPGVGMTQQSGQGGFQSTQGGQSQQGYQPQMQEHYR